MTVYTRGRARELGAGGGSRVGKVGKQRVLAESRGEAPSLTTEPPHTPHPHAASLSPNSRRDSYDDGPRCTTASMSSSAALRIERASPRNVGATKLSLTSPRRGATPCQPPSPGTAVGSTVPSAAEIHTRSEAPRPSSARATRLVAVSGAKAEGRRGSAGKEESPASAKFAATTPPEVTENSITVGSAGGPSSTSKAEAPAESARAAFCANAHPPRRTTTSVRLAEQQPSGRGEQPNPPSSAGA